jgi:hypothetical protein
MYGTIMGSVRALNALILDISSCASAYLRLMAMPTLVPTAIA